MGKEEGLCEKNIQVYLTWLSSGLQILVNTQLGILPLTMTLELNDIAFVKTPTSSFDILTELYEVIQL